MPLLFDEDYEILKDSGLKWEEDIEKRYFVVTNYPVKAGLYVSDGKALTEIEVLFVIPPNYNMSGGDMFWTHPILSRADGKEIPAISSLEKRHQPQFFKSKEYFRWSRHWPAESWEKKKDNIQKILSRLEWALSRPDADK